MALPDLTNKEIFLRTFDGAWNNLETPEAGYVPYDFNLPPANQGVVTLRVTNNTITDLTQFPTDINDFDNTYEDGFNAIHATNVDGNPLPSPRVISNIVSAQDEVVPSPNGASSMVVHWGQVLALDTALTRDGTIPIPIPVPEDDPVFTSDIPVGRHIGTGVDENGNFVPPSPDSPLLHLTSVNPFLDLHPLYGYNEARANLLRTNGGSGAKLLTQTIDSLGEFLPFNSDGKPDLANGGAFPQETLFYGGDSRVNENQGVAAIINLFTRNHNLWVDRISATPNLNREIANFNTTTGLNLSRAEYVYQKARAINIAQYQAITLNEFFPVLLGGEGLGNYTGYSAEVNPATFAESNANAFRLGHTQIRDTFPLVDPDGNLLEERDLRGGFFDTSINTDFGIEALLRGASEQSAQRTDTLISDSVRNFLFGGGAGRDLPAINIQRSRDYGISSINEIRSRLGLPEYNSLNELTGGNTELNQKLIQAYGSENNALNGDFWIIGLAEPEAEVDGMLGETNAIFVKQQFNNYRLGDRFWFENPDNPYIESGMLSEEFLQEVTNVTLADILNENAADGLAGGVDSNLFLIGEQPVLDDPFTRFQNSAQPGTYLFADETESQSVRDNFSPPFVEEGEAFKVSIEPNDELVKFNRFQNSLVPGTYLYADEAESVSIRQNFPQFEEEGTAFYAYGADANKGQDFYRFQNTQLPGTYIFVGEEERQSILANFPQFVEEGIAFEAMV
ncbi:peroxidase family protein [Geminocystis sp. CENA526]|uniref:peroxidase family protein n=1 Tax=Geminocystis sp. CENA526 TaxID=1355871 RepID=UPI003D6ED18F